MVPFRLTVLGPPELRAPNGDPIRFRTRKHFALLIYLAVEPSIPHRRDRLATLLWGGADVDEARHSLATALSLLRGRLGADAFDANRDAVRLVPGVVLSDLEGLERDDPTDTGVPALGAFLEEFEIDNSPDFLAWKEGQRARLLPLLHTALTQRIAESRRQGDSRRTEELAQRLLRVDDLSEEAVRAQLEGRAIAGDRIGALRLFDRWRTRLADELGSVPSASLDRVASRLRRGNWDRPAVVAASPSSHVAEERAFIGRTAEFASCYDVWEKARAGDPHHVLLSGDTGSGKTTLVERLMTTVSLEGATVARVACYELERELPFAVIGGLISHLLELPGASATASDHLAELARLVPKVRQRYPTLPAPVPTEREGARLRFSEAVMALVAAIADEHPVVIAVDDIHLADAASLAVLHLILRTIGSLPLMAILTSSTLTHSGTTEIARFVEDDQPMAMRHIRLGPLSGEQAQELLEQIVARGPQPGSTLRRAILSGAHGNPMILELLVADWRRRGDECLALSLGAMTTSAGAPPEETFRRLVGQSLAALDPESRAVAELGAILGQRLNDLSMYALVDLPVARTMRAMASLTSRRILRDAGATLEFASDIIRGQCYLGMSAPMRRMLHGSIADRLLAEDGPHDPISGLEIAWHLVRADRLGEAVPHLLLGGREAIKQAAPHEADLALSTGLPALAGHARRTAILLLAEAQQELGRWADSLQQLDFADEPFTESERCCRDVYSVIARRWLGHLSASALIDATNTLLDIATKDIDIETRVKALAASVRLLALTRNEEQLRRLEGLVVSVGDANMDPFQSLHIILTRGWVVASRHDTPGALNAITVGVELAEQFNIESSITVRLLIGQGNLLAMSGCYSRALDPLERAARLADRLDNRTLKGECAALLSVVEGRLGHSSSQIDWARKALSVFSRTEWCAAVIGATYELGLGLVSEGRYAEAQFAVNSLSSCRSQDVPQWAIQAALLCEADVVAMSGNIRRACILAKKATTGTLRQLWNVAYAGQFARWVALLAIRQTNSAPARERLRNAFPTTEHLDRKDEVEVLAAIATLESHLGNESKGEWTEIRQRLEQLPPSVAIMLRRLGTHADSLGRPWGLA